MRSRRITLCFKLVGSFVALLALIVVLGAIGLAAIHGLGRSLDVAVNTTAKKMDLTAAMHSGVTEMRTHALLAEVSILNNKIADGAMGSVSGTVCASCHTADRVTSNRKIFEAAAAGIAKQAAELRALPLNERESKALAALLSGVTNWAPLYGRYLDLAGQHDFPTAHQIMVEQIYPLVARIDAAADGLNAEQQLALVAAREQATQQASQSLWRAGGTVTVAFIAGILGLWIVRQVAYTLRHRTSELMEMSRQVAATAGQLSQSNEALALGAAEQADSIRQTSAATEEVQTRTHLNVTGAQGAAEIMAGETRFAAEAGQKLDDLLASMKQMVAASDRISHIIRTIDGIAFQTNILALNAAVEAARAGEAGLGFSVVADEVRALARRSAEAARDTADLVSSSIEYNNAGTAKLNDVSQLIVDMTRRIAGVRQTIDEVNQNGQEQARGLDQIAFSIAQMEQATGAIAAQAEQRAAASRQVSAQADQLRDVVTGLRELV